MEENTSLLGYKLFQFHKAFKAAIKNEMDKLNLPQGYAFVLKYLKESSQDNVNQRHIVEYAKCKPSTISITLQNMENDGFIKRSKSKDDSRKINVSLTKSGLKAAQDIENIFKQLEDKLSNVFDKETKDDFLIKLQKLQNELEKDGDN